MYIIVKLRVAAAVVCGAIGFALGDFDNILIALMVIMLLDLFTSACLAVYEKSVCSRDMFWNVVRKIGTLVIVAVANFTDMALELGGGLRSLVISCYIGIEGISIFESWGKMGLPMPQRLKDVFKGVAEQSNIVSKVDK